MAPREGEPVSAGVLSVPSVLGQTAEEVLFYPWSTYDAQAMLSLPDAVRQEYADTLGADGAEGHVAALAAFYAEALSPFQLLFDAEYDGEAISRAIEVGQSEQLGHPIFLKEFYASGGEGGEELLLSFARATTASSGQSISYLVKPARSETLSQERQDRALAQVRADLESLLQLDEKHWESNELVWLLRRYYEFSHTFGLYYEPLEVLSQNIEVSQAYLSFSYGDPYTNSYSNSYSNSYPEHEYTTDTQLRTAPEEVQKLSLDAALDQVEKLSGCTVQLVSTPQQIVLLFTGPDRSVVGVYYDIQLERYSGIGLSGG